MWEIWALECVWNFNYLVIEFGMLIRTCLKKDFTNIKETK